MLKIRCFIKILISISFIFIVSCQQMSLDKKEPVEKQMSDQEKVEIKKIQEQTGGDPSLLGDYYRKKRYRKLLIEAGRLLSKNEHDLKALSALGLYHMDRGEYGAARIFFEKALKKHPEQAGLYNNIGVIFLKEGNLESALISFKKAYELDNANFFVQSNLGSIFMKYMDYIQGEPLITDAYGRNPNDDIIANNYGVILRTQGQYEEAEQVYKKIIARNPRNLPANVNYAILLVEYMRNYERGKKIVNKLEFLNPRSKYIINKIKDLQIKMEKIRNIREEENVIKAKELKIDDRGGKDGLEDKTKDSLKKDQNE